MGLLSDISKAARSHPDKQPLAVAKTVFGNLTKAALLELLANEIENEQRDITRGMERTAFRQLLRAQEDRQAAATLGTELEQVANATLADPIEPFRALFSKTFALGNASEVTWALATKAEHQQRITFLERMRAGIANTIGLHQEAIERIDAAGVTCLADIDAANEVAA